MRISTTFIAALLSIGFLSLPAAAQGKKPFTAVAVQSMKGQSAQEARVFVDGTKTRIESTDHGRKVVRISLPEQRVMRILFPEDKVYAETSIPADVQTPVIDNDTPCPPMDGLTCKKITDAKFGDMDVEQWQQHHAPSKTSSTLWWEPVRKMIVRQEFPDGAVMQLTPAGTVDFHGRQAERWDIAFARADGKVTQSYQLVDTEVGIVVKKENPELGMSQELRDLKIVNSEAGWFEVPAGYQRIEPSQMPQR